MTGKGKFWLGALGLSLCAGTLWASDHGDAPAVSGKPTDLTDLYAFQSPANAANLVLVGNVQGLLSPAATATAAFDPHTLLEFNIDTDGDNIEDLVVQCVPTNGKMYIYGPLKPAQPGLSSTITGPASAVVDVTPYRAAAPNVATSKDGLQVFAGPRDDPFFFDLGQYQKIIAGQATGFNNPGTDALAGTNVLSVVVELPKALLKSSTGKLNIWLETKQKS